MTNKSNKIVGWLNYGFGRDFGGESKSINEKVIFHFAHGEIYCRIKRENYLRLNLNRII